MQFYYQDGGVMPPQQAQMQAPPQQMPQAQQGQDQLMQLMVAYFQQQGMNEQQQQQFIQEFQGLQPQEQDQIIAYIQQQLQGGQQQQESPMGEQQEYQQGQQNPQEEGQEMMESGGINLNPKNAGIFTAKAKSHGMSVSQFENHVLANKSNFPMETIKQAQFSKNARSWSNQVGGEITPVTYGMSRMAYDYKPMGFNQVGREYESNPDYQLAMSQGVLPPTSFSQPVDDRMVMYNPVGTGTNQVINPQYVDNSFPEVVVDNTARTVTVPYNGKDVVMNQAQAYSPYVSNVRVIDGGYSQGTGHYEAAQDQRGRNNRVVLIDKVNEAQTTAPADQTKAQQLISKHYVPAVRAFQEEIANISGLATDKTGRKKSVYDGVFGENTYSSAVAAYAKLNGKSIDEVNQKEVNTWIRSKLPDFKIPERFLVDVSLGYEAQKAGGISDGTTVTHTKITMIPETKVQEMQRYLNEKTQYKVGKVDGKIGTQTLQGLVNKFADDNGIVEGKTDATTIDKFKNWYKSWNIGDLPTNFETKVADMLGIKNYTVSPIKAKTDTIPAATDTTDLAKVAQMRNDSIAKASATKLPISDDPFDLSKYGKTKTTVVNDMPTLVGDDSYYYNVNKNTKRVNQGFVGGSGSWINSTTPQQYSDSFIDLKHLDLAFDPKTNLFLRRGFNGTYTKPSSTIIETFLNTEKGKQFVDNYKANKFKQVGGVSDSLGVKASTVNSEYKENKYAVGGTVKKQSLPIDSDVNSSIRKFVDKATPDQDYLNRLNSGSANTSKFVKINDNTVFDPVAKKVVVKNAYGTWGSPGSSDRGATGTTLANILKTKEGQAFLKNNRHLIP